MFSVLANTLGASTPDKNFIDRTLDIPAVKDTLHYVKDVYSTTKVILFILMQDPISNC